ncbi:DNA topology modulation protein FlaR [Roseibium sp.]|uniref:DNA topology modulation protein FlaR n=1 Tax=Roseibium sp. TaxID=1936156 RepID=UPI003BAF250B
MESDLRGKPCLKLILTQGVLAKGEVVTRSAERLGISQQCNGSCGQGVTMRRLIVVGANGSGKSFLAARLHKIRPDVPLVAFDAIKLTKDWHRRKQQDIDAELARVVATDAWLLEGGPSVLGKALPRAEAVIWLDPPELLRLWRLACRPWRNFGKERTEIPSGNRDWPLQQYRFAFQSLMKRDRFRAQITSQLHSVQGQSVWHCRTQSDVEQAVSKWQS